ncbi:MAG TPA: hypothetical protein ENK18_02545 [Deltaproteobacteria bacterium]|nr:hypothetical protein [Deltaproteobacteria bacterium]
MLGANHIGRYQLVERLAVGGMAEVHLACQRGDHSLDRLVVIKRILPHLAASPTFIEAFQREANLAARVNHPNVVKIFELGESGGLPFIVMEYVPGSTMKALIRASRQQHTPPSIDLMLHLLTQACAGAHAAHELTDAAGRPCGLVHRDISPHNLMVDDDAHVKLLDFGIAKPRSGTEQTRAGMLKGKIPYMSPEQLRQGPLDRRADVFSLGVVGYELLTGTRPFEGESEIATMQAILEGGFTPLCSRRPDVPRAVASAIEVALQGDPDDRWSTADVLRRELRLRSQEAGIFLDPDRAALKLQDLLGRAHAERRRAVEEALERTLAPGAASAPPPPIRALPSAEATSSSLPSLLTENRQVVAAGGVVASIGLFLGLGGLLVASIAIVAVIWAVIYLAPGSIQATGPGSFLPEDAVVMRLAPTVTPSELRALHEPLREHLEASLKRPIAFDIGENYQATAQALIDGEILFAMLPYNTTRMALGREPALQILGVKVVGDSETIDGQLVVRDRAEARSLKDLRGGTLCYPDLLSNTGYRMPRAYITSQGLDPDEDFVPRISGNHLLVLEDLLSGACDLGGTFSGNFETARDRGIDVDQLRVLAITGSTPHDALVASPAAPPAITAALRSALLAFEPPAVEEGFVERGDRITGFTAPGDDYL